MISFHPEAGDTCQRFLDDLAKGSYLCQVTFGDGSTADVQLSQDLRGVLEYTFAVYAVLWTCGGPTGETFLLDFCEDRVEQSGGRYAKSLMVY